METVFISYSHKDGLWVRDWLLPRLEGAGVRVRIDFRDFEIGQPSIINMEKAIEECKRTFLVITPHWIQSQWAKFEALILQTDDPANEKKRLIPLLLEPCQLPKRLAMFTHADFTDRNNWESQLGRLLGQMGVTAAPGAASAAGYVRPGDKAVSLYKLPTTGKDLFGREKELAFLDAAWVDGDTHIVSLVAWGGVGKTALVNQWLNEMQQQNYRGAHRVFGWSFYSQGAEEGKQVSADDFFQETLTWFGDPHPEAGSNVEKGRRLARLAQKQKTLLILDGLEPLQYPPGEVHGFDGKLKDAGMSAFLKQLAAACPDTEAPCGLCIITTRQQVADLEHKKGYAVKEVMLERLSEEAGAALLKNLGVTIGSAADVKAAVKEYDGHALALTLLGQYIKNVHHGDLRRRDEIPLLTREHRQGRHARRVMEAYERRYLRFPQWKFLRRFKMFCRPRPELNILYIMGLFDRPAEVGAVEALKSAPAIQGVTDRLQQLSEEDWQLALSHLRTARLLGEENPQKPGTLDCHPLVREHFGQKLRQQNPAGWKEAHKRLYNYFKDLPKKKYPDTLQEMEPLFTAVAHGCKAEFTQKALNEVYYTRVQRDEKTNYCCNKLGAFGADLSIVSHFFDIPWNQPKAELNDYFKGKVLSWAAFRLRAVGRLQEAIQPMKAGLEISIQQNDWIGAAVDAGNLSELMLTLGEVPQAVTYACQSVTYADQSRDDFQKDSKRTTLADALHQAGRFEEAGQWFRDAEEMLKKRNPKASFLYSLQGFRFCDLLLGQGKYEDVMKRADETIKNAIENKWLLDMALDQLSLGRAGMMQAVKEKSDDFSAAMDFLDKAVEGLRYASVQDFLVKGLFARAECYRRMTDFSKAGDDLDEAKEIAELGSMKLYICDYHLEAGKLCRARGKETEAKQHFQTAENMIQEMKYYRRKSECPGMV